MRRTPNRRTKALRDVLTRGGIIVFSLGVLAFIVYKVVPNRVSYMQEWALEYLNVPLDACRAD